MGLKEVLAKYGEKRRRLKDMQDELRLRKTAEDRMKTGQERDLEDYMEKDRQKKIKEQVKVFKSREMKEFWASPYKSTIKPQRNGISLKTNLLGGRVL
jgi:hypothetical protein